MIGGALAVTVSACGLDRAAPARAACGDLVETWCARAFECTTAAERRARNAPLTYDACVAQWRTVAGCDREPLGVVCGAQVLPTTPYEACATELAAASCAAIEARTALCADLCPAPPSAAPLRVSWEIVDGDGHPLSCSDIGAIEAKVEVSGDTGSTAAEFACSEYLGVTAPLPIGHYEVTVSAIDAYERTLRVAETVAAVAPPITSVGPVQLVW